jgi:hypothetical protein
MGLCSEVADDGENLEDHPVLSEQLRPQQGVRFSAEFVAKFEPFRVEPFSRLPDKILAWDIVSLGE